MKIIGLKQICHKYIENKILKESTRNDIVLITTKKRIRRHSLMNKSITQKMKYKQSVVKFSYKYGVKKAAIKFNEWPKTIYRWRERYDGSLESLRDKSRRPHYHPNQHTEAEIKLIKNYKANNKETGLVVLWVKLKEVGYTRTVKGLYNVLCRLGIYKKAPRKKKER